ncbi:MAG: hypothetical protein A2Y17_01425 [Clostridiales bacterium GWF2_38_85]|nr:MAG: hypothetical protein A2Y17_01425 [Clostridiales bacterium GWF2_38_85]HBL85181.1 hypothetical protein [Clostridiales bacterium]
MKIKPVSYYKAPKYPDMQTASINPELLKKLPSRWQHNKAVIAAITALTAISLASCESTIRTYSETSDGSLVYIGPSAVAPIFEHGKGTGALGCEVVAPPAFMSEQEALAIIKNEARKAGIDLDDTPEGYPVSPDVSEAQSNENAYYQPVSLELSDEDKGIAISFISWEEAETGTPALYASYKTKERAKLQSCKKSQLCFSLILIPIKSIDKIQEKTFAI